jgi:hypothetical protein
VTLLLLLVLLGLWVPPYANASGPEPSTWHFDEDRPDQLPPKFAVGTFFDGRPAGEWKVTTTPKALSPPNVFAQLRGKGAEHHYNVVLIEDTHTANLDLSVSFLPISGRADMGGGLIWRVTDDRNYYLTRANPLEQNIRVYHVVKGIRKMIGNYNEIIDIKKWHNCMWSMKAAACRSSMTRSQSLTSVMRPSRRAGLDSGLSPMRSLISTIYGFSFFPEIVPHTDQAHVDTFSTPKA